jgi:hypothetical protein
MSPCEGQSSDSDAENEFAFADFLISHTLQQLIDKHITQTSIDTDARRLNATLYIKSVTSLNKCRVRQTTLNKPTKMKALVLTTDLETHDFKGQEEIEWDNENESIGNVLKNRLEQQTHDDLLYLHKFDLEEEFHADKLKFRKGATYKQGNSMIIQIFGSYTDYENHTHWSFNYQYTIVSIENHEWRD